ncbi:MAG TPA: alpha/beta hydrolase [Gemmatimonadaceae bacterium]|jgi:haloalkane dehalogenase|nr:alpha/beta hydrolase [Gemmatimonadaceae bacterium]
MDRRQFLETTTGAIASATLAACMRHGAQLATSAAPSTPIDAAAFHASRRFADTTFGRIAYVERGSGRAALFLHGYPLNGFQWRGALERLSPYRRCIAVDFMGLGYSEIPEHQSLAPDQQADMLAAVLDRLSISRVDVVASDSGGAVAQLFVTRHATRVRTLLLTNCDTESDSPPPSFVPVIKLAEAGTLADRFLVPQLADKVLARSPKGIGGLAYTYPADPTDQAVDCYFAPLVSTPLRRAQFHGYTTALAQNALAGIAPALRASSVPTRIVWGTGDTIFSPASPDWLDHAFARSRGVRRVDGAKVFFPEEMPDLIASELHQLWGLT